MNEPVFANDYEFPINQPIPDGEPHTYLVIQISRPMRMHYRKVIELFPFILSAKLIEDYPDYFVEVKIPVDADGLKVQTLISILQGNVSDIPEVLYE